MRLPCPSCMPLAIKARPVIIGMIVMLAAGMEVHYVRCVLISHLLQLLFWHLLPCEDIKYQRQVQLVRWPT